MRGGAWGPAFGRPCGKGAVFCARGRGGRGARQRSRAGAGNGGSKRRRPCMGRRPEQPLPSAGLPPRPAPFPSGRVRRGGERPGFRVREGRACGVVQRRAPPPAAGETPMPQSEAGPPAKGAVAPSLVPCGILIRKQAVSAAAGVCLQVRAPTVPA